MKKAFILFFTVVLIVVCLASCDWFVNDSEDTTEQQDHEHTFEYVQYETGHFKQYTCGCPSPDIMGEHYDNDEDCYCDVCGFFVGDEIEWQYSETHHWWVPQYGDGPSPGVVHGYGEHENFDADMFCDICGYDMSDRPTPTNYFLRNRSGLEWMNEITAEDIAEIKMISGGGGPLPPISLTHISSSTDKAVISYIFEQYYWLDTTPMDRMPVICDGGYFTVQFVLNDGTVKQLSFLIGEYISDAEGHYYKIDNLPVFRDGTNFVNYYGFENWNEESCVYLMDGLSVAVIPVAELEFSKLTDDIELGGKEPTYYIEMNGERIYFLSDCYFYIGDDRSTYYQLVGKNLDEIIDEYKGKYSVTMNDEDWLYEDLKPTYKAGEEVSVKLMIPYDLGFLLFVNGERVKPLECNYNYCEFVFTMPECDVVIDFKTYKGFLPHYNYYVLIETYWEKIPKADSVSVINYYGEFDSGAIVAMMSCSEYDYTEALWDEVIDGVVIHYNNGNRIIVLYEGEFYNLTTAYENGYITKSDLNTICDLHNDFCKISF